MAMTPSSRLPWVVQLCVTFLAWTLFSFMCHYFGKAFLTTSVRVVASSSMDNIFISSAFAFVLTFIKLVLCASLVQLEGGGSSQHLQSRRLVVSCHVIATFATNLSLALIFASSTATIKLLEPATSAILQYHYLHMPMSRVAILSLPFMLGGAMVFMGIPDFSDQLLGIAMGLTSNVFFGLRNIFIKKCELGLTVTLKPNASLVAIFVGLVMSLLYQVEHQSQTTRLGDLLFASRIATLSAICHVTYSYISTALVLKEMSVVSHSVANIVKRTLLVLLLYAFGQRVTSPCNFLGLPLCVIGLALFTWDKGKAVTRTHSTELESSAGKPKSVNKSVISVALFASLTLMVSFYRCQREHAFPMPQRDTATLLPVPVPASFATSDRAAAISQAFYHDSFVRPSDKTLQPDLNRLSSQEAVRNSSWFLQQRLVNIPSQANYISKQLKTSEEVIREAQRIHFNVLADPLKGFKYAIWVDVSAFENKGDSCVTVGETYFLRRLNIEVVYYCNFHVCNSWRLDVARNISLMYSPKDLVILGHGGGNLLGYYRNDEIRYAMIRLFKDYQIFIFPQGIWIPNDNENTPLIQKAKAMYCCVPNLTIVLREKPSYDKARRLFRGITRLLMSPDIAFQVGPVSRITSPVFDILWLKRDDKENIGPMKVPPYPHHYTLHISEWIHWKTNAAGNNLEQAHYNAANGHLYLQRGRVVITDRLHGHIFSILNDIPHVLIDPLGDKLTNYHYTWTASLHNVRVAKNITEAIRLAVELLDVYKDTLPAKIPFLELSEDFKPPRPGIPNMKYP